MNGVFGIGFLWRGLVVLVLGVAALVGAPAAGAYTFGGDLSQPVGETNCAGQTCTIANVVPSSYAPIPGVVTAVHVRTGGGTYGRVQPVILRSYFRNSSEPGKPDQPCCFVVDYGPVQQLQPNTINTISTFLPMVEQAPPPSGDTKTVATNDFIALSFLDPGTSVPLYSVFQGTFYYWAPAADPSTFPPDGPNALTGFNYSSNPGGPNLQNVALAMSADISPVSAGGSGGTGGGGGVHPFVGSPIAFPAANDQLLGNTAQIPLVCRLPTTCTGTLSLRTPNGRAAAAKKKRKKGSPVLGTARFTIGAGKRATIKVRLNAAGKRYLGRRKRITVLAVVTENGKTVTSRITLVIPQKHKKKKR